MEELKLTVDIIAQVRDESIDAVLDEIKVLCPTLVIIEQ